MSSVVEIDMSEFKEFFGSVEKAAKGDFRKEFELFLEGLGNEFLRILQDEIVRRKVLDSRQLLASFEKGADGNVWGADGRRPNTGSRNEPRLRRVCKRRPLDEHQKA